jgi:hypothetical protein
MNTKPKPKTKYRYRCPYCNRAFKHGGSLQKHRMKGTQPGWCTAMGAAALGRQA